MKPEDVPKNYDRAAKRYDKWTDVVFGRVLGIEQLREHAIDLLGDLHGKVVLDVGCGRGRNFPFLVPRVGASGRIIGVDYSPGMLDVARQRIEREHWDNVELRRDDAAQLATVSAPVDAEERYLSGGGIIVSGTAPSRERRS